MKRKVKAGIGLMLSLMMFIGMFPITGLAADDETVLTSIYHSSAVSAVDVSGKKTATFTVPYTYSSDTVDLSNGLNISFDSSVYTSASAGFPSGSKATVGGDPVSMTVTYQKKHDDTAYSAQYSIYVVRASGTAPSFSGTISKTLTLPGSITFTAADFTGKYKENDGGPLQSITITGSNPTFGSLKLDGKNYVPGESVSISKLERGKLAFEATGVGTVSYIVKAYASGDAQTSVGTVTLTIAVQSGSGAGTVTYETDKNTPVVLKTADFTSAFSDATGNDLSYVVFTRPSSDYGRLYYNYRAPSDYDSVVSSDTKYYRDVLPDLSRITFVPAANYTGTVTLPYEGYNTDGDVFAGKLTVAVSDTDADAEVVEYKTDDKTPVSISASDISDVCEDLTGKALSYVMFDLPLSAGKLYYNYKSPSDYDSIVAEDTEYYKKQYPYLSNIDYVPKSGYSGTVTISYTGYNTQGDSFTGEIEISVDEKDEKDGCHFTDVGKNLSWAAGAINYLYKNQIITGNKAGRYNPNASISRGDFILMLCRAFDLEVSFDGNFSDVSRDSYYYNAIGIAKKLGIGKGTNGRFNPNAALSRQDAMVLILRALDAADISLSSGNGDDLPYFSDSDKISDYAVDSFSKLVKANIVQGNGKRLNPKNSVSRAEMAVILHRILTK